jgi:hypothetical protein
MDFRVRLSSPNACLVSSWLAVDVYSDFTIPAFSHHVPKICAFLQAINKICRVYRELLTKFLQARWWGAKYATGSSERYLWNPSIPLGSIHCACSYTLMMEAMRSSVTSVNVYQTIRRHIPEDSTLYSKFNFIDCLMLVNIEISLTFIEFASEKRNKEVRGNKFWYMSGSNLSQCIVHSDWDVHDLSQPFSITLDCSAKNENLLKILRVVYSHSLVYLPILPSIYPSIYLFLLFPLGA